MLINKSQDEQQPTLNTRRWLIGWATVCSLMIPLAVISDFETSRLIRSIKIPGDLNKAVNLSEAFAHGSGVAVILLALIVCDETNRRKLWWVAINTLMIGSIANALKYFIPRIRPYADQGIETVWEGWLGWLSGFGRHAPELSFPSGHSATASALAIGLSLVYPKGRYLFAFVAVVSCVQRMASSAHYPSDVLGGCAIAFAISAIMLAWKPN